MSLTIAGRVVPQRNSLSQLCHLTLSFIAGGVRWLDWTIDNPTVRHEFPDETELVVQVQQQLHASRLTLLPRLQLMISPIKLMTLGLADLRLNSAKRSRHSGSTSTVTWKIAGPIAWGRGPGGAPSSR